jgi:hypothetical protein
MTLRWSVFPFFAALLLVCPGIGIQGAAASGGEIMPAGQVRQSVIAGTWYPGSPERLRQEIQGFLSQAQGVDLEGRLVALISPHAGYRYSGQVAAYAYKVLEKHRFSSVVLIAPSHRAYFSGVSVYDRGGYETPLGVVPLDRELVSALKERESRIRYVPDAHSREHSLEIQLPFLQVLLPEFKLVPLVMGEQNLETCQWLAEAVADCIGDKSVLIVASSDLSHFHPYTQAKRLDQVVLDKVNDFDPRGLSESLASGACEACGGGPMVSAMLIARRLGANKSRVLHYANSGDVTGDHSGVVGYMAAAFWANPGTKKRYGGERQRSGVELGLTSEEKDLLLRLAREVITARCHGEEPPEPRVDSPTLNKPSGAFVSLHKHGRLRGCIGNIHAEMPLAETVAKMAAAAAFQDPRFPPVRAEELEELDVEISVLTPLRQISDVKAIEVGTHGLYVKSGGYAGLLLPQVATEWGWDRKTFLEHTCTKAGLPKDAWKDKATEIYTFSADVF